jgi:hypothetical protein
MLEECIRIIEDNLEEEELVKITRILYGMYDPFLLDAKLWCILEQVFPHPLFTKIEKFKRTLVGHSIINQLVIRYFPGEITIKFNFIKKYLNRFNEITTFELNVGSSRLDIGRINGKSIAYEIKTELDTLEKLEKQISDYSKVFEYIYVIIHQCHYEKVLEIIPDYCGVIIYNLKKDICKFSFKRKALKNCFIDPREQLSVFSKKELDWLIKHTGERCIPIERQSKEELLLKNNSSPKINALFKRALKVRYKTNWEHLCNNFIHIKPLDVQSFFKTKADPYWVYYKNSSIV